MREILSEDVFGRRMEQGEGGGLSSAKKRQNRKETEYINFVLVVGRLGG
jgi:hypothetical protein